MRRSHLITSWLKLSMSPPCERATSSSSVDDIREGALFAELDFARAHLAFGRLGAAVIVDPADERARLEQEVRIHKRLRELLLLFARNVSGSLGLAAALEALPPEIRALYPPPTAQTSLHHPP